MRNSRLVILGVVAILVLLFVPALEVRGGKYQVGSISYSSTCSGSECSRKINFGNGTTAYWTCQCTNVTTYGSIGFMTLCIGATYQTGVNEYFIRAADCATTVPPNPINVQFQCAPGLILVQNATGRYCLSS